MSLNKTKIIVTLGPSCDKENVLLDMINEGVYGFRINFSHSSYKDIHKRYLLINKLLKNDKKRNLIFGDIQGPKVRLGDVSEFKADFGEKVFISSFETKKEKTIFVDYQDFLKYLSKGDRIFIDDGKIELLVEAVKKDYAVCSVLVGGIIYPRKGVNIVNKKLPLPSITDKDYKDLEFALELGMDSFAISFVRNKHNVIEIRDYLYKIKKKDYFLIAKIEDREGFENIDEIIDVANCIMVARGDLGISVNRALVPLIQKEIIDKCNKRGILDIVATQMLETMISNPYPTRAEVNDVAVAVMQGADCVMLSGETAVGKYPILAVREMKNIIEEVNKYLRFKKIKF